MRENVAKFPTRSKAFTIFAMHVRASQRALGISMKPLRRQFLQFAVGAAARFLQPHVLLSRRAMRRSRCA